MRDSDGNIIPSGLLKYDKASKISFKNHRKQAHIKGNTALSMFVNMAQVLILIIYGTNHIADCIADLARC